MRAKTCPVTSTATLRALISNHYYSNRFAGVERYGYGH